MPIQLRTLTSTFPENARVLLRVDFNVPLNSDGKILDSRRITNHLPTIRFLRAKKAKIILLAHLGKPGGKVVAALSFAPLLEQISKLLQEPLQLSTLDDCIASEKITLLENIRFHPGEEVNDAAFSKRLASLADLYVNDAFSVSHRSHASIVGVTHYVPSFAGLALESEVKNLSTVLTSPKHPVTLVIGGKKVSDKIGVIQHLLPKVDHVLMGGACANTFIAAQKKTVKASYIETSMLPICEQLLQAPNHKKVILPCDFAEMDNAYLDIGPSTIERYSKLIAASKTVIWAGPMGKYEDKRFNKGNQALLQAITKKDILSIVGGGDTLAALQNLPLFDKISFTSLGGGAMLEFLAKESLPGVEVLKNKP